MQVKRLKNPVNQVHNHSEVQSANKKMIKKTVAKEGEMKTSFGLSIEDEMRGRTSKLTEDVNKNRDSP